MRGSSHLIAGLTTGIALSSALLIEPKEILWVPLIVGSLAPDFDEPAATISRPGSFLRRFLPRALADFIDAIAMSLSAIVKLLCGHRGLSHWPIIPLSLFFIGVYLLMPWLLWFSIGYLLHILLDSCTVQGVPLFAPFKMNKVSVLSLKTEGLGEKVFCLLCGVYIAFWGYSRFFNGEHSIFRDQMRVGESYYNGP